MRHLSSSYRWSFAIGLLLAVACFLSTYWIDVYARYVYPVVSGCLSWLSSLLPFAVQEVTVALLVAFVVWQVVQAVRRKLRWRRLAANMLLVLLWTYVWFYMAWCNNYSRSTIYQRANAVPAVYDEAAFDAFVDAFILSTNEAWTSDTLVLQSLLEAEVKDFYSTVPSRFGLATPQRWQHPKTPTFSHFYSAVGVSGFMAPLFAESFVSADVPQVDYPFVYAHEYAHLMGVSSEAEANWWAFHACLSSSRPAVRYSGYKGLLGYVLSNARSLLEAEAYRDKVALLRPEVLLDCEATRQHWMALRSPLIDELQDMVYDLFLKGNNIPSGRKNYSEVVTMLLSDITLL